MKPPFFGINVAKCNLGKVNLEAMLVSCFPSYSRGGPMPLAGAPRDLYTQLLACSSSQSVVAIACCLHAILCSGFCLLAVSACTMTARRTNNSLAATELVIRYPFAGRVVWSGKLGATNIFNSFYSCCCCWCPQFHSNRCNRRCCEGLVSSRKRSWL